MTDDPTTTLPPGGQPQALTDDEFDGVIATLAVNCSLGEEDAARLLATLDEARARAALLEALGREQQRLNEVMVASLQRGLEKLQASEALARDQQATNVKMLAFLERGLAQLEASEAEVARLRALLERSVEYFDYMEDRGYRSVRVLRSDVAAALAATDRVRAPAVEHEPTCLLGKYAYAGCTCSTAGESKARESKPRSPYLFQSTCGVCGTEIGGDGDVCGPCATDPVRRERFSALPPAPTDQARREGTDDGK